MNGARALTFLLALALGATAILPAGAGENLLEELERIEAELLEDRVQLGTEIAETADTIAAAEDLTIRGRIELELLADEKLALLAERAEPAAARQALVLVRYTRGDPRLDSFVLDLIAGESEIGPAIERTMYTVLLEDADTQVEGYDDLVDEVDDRREEILDEMERAVDDLPGLRRDYDAAIERLEAVTTELVEVQAQIDWERSAGDRARLTGLPDGSRNDRPALAIKIDNVPPARPQVGINQADVVFEEVVEGELTRLVAVFHSGDSNPVGPIRSVRTSDLLILGNFNRPLFGNSGGNANVMARLLDSTLIDVGAISEFTPYYRQPGRPAPHNLFSNTDDLRQAGSGSGAGPPPPLFPFRRPGNPLPESAEPAVGVTISFGATTVSYAWDAEVAGWGRVQDRAVHADADGVGVAPANVIVQFVDYRPSRADSRSPEADVIGDGPVWVFTEGHVIEGRWKRENLEALTTYEDGNGDPIELAPGRTWIELAPENSALLR